MRNMRVRLLEPKSKYMFPPVESAKHSGLLAVGGDLSVGRLLTAYAQGIFPWYGAGGPIMWWCPDPRCVLMPSDLHISRSLQRAINKKEFEITFDQAFKQVIQNCSQILRVGQNGTWLQPEMIEAYIKLHELGVAHSVEAWYEGELVGGLYGVALGSVFFGESMFHRRANASKIAFVYLVKNIEEKGFKLIDCQQTTSHMLHLGAKEIPRKEFIQYIKSYIEIN